MYGELQTYRAGLDAERTAREAADRKLAEAIAAEGQERRTDFQRLELRLEAQQGDMQRLSSDLQKLVAASEAKECVERDAAVSPTSMARSSSVGRPGRVAPQEEWQPQALLFGGLPRQPKGDLVAHVQEIVNAMQLQAGFKDVRPVGIDREGQS
jgi:hypothetical protein